MSYKIQNGKLVKNGTPPPAPRQAQTTRTWAMGSIDVIANDDHCFSWQGTYQDAVELRKRWLTECDQIYALGAQSVARRASGYLMAYGMPDPGDIDMRPSHAGEKWSLAEVEVYKRAVLWLALREHVPNIGTKLEDVFVGKQILVWFKGDRDEIIAQTRTETRTDAGLDDCNRPSITGAGEFTMTVGVDKDYFRLDPDKAIGISLIDMIALAGRPVPADVDELLRAPVFVPRMPIDAAEADAMMKMMTITTDTTDPLALLKGPKTYVGYTDGELCRGKPAVRIR